MNPVPAPLGKRSIDDGFYPTSRGGGGEVDKLDIHILRALRSTGGQTAKPSALHRSLSSIARELRVDETTVASRLGGLRRSGFLKGWSVGLNPHLLGQEMAQVWVDVRDSLHKADVIGKICLIRGVVVVKDLYGGSLGVMLYYDDAVSFRHTTELMTRLSGAPTFGWMPEPFPPCTTVFSELDVQLVGHLQGDPLQSYARLAHALHCSTRTARRRIGRLVAEGAIHLVVELDPTSLEGGMMGSLFVSYVSSREKIHAEAKIYELLGDRLLLVHRAAPLHASIGLLLTSVVQAREILKRVRETSGVREARLDLVQEVISLYGIYRDQLARLRHTRYYRSPSGTQS